MPKTGRSVPTRANDHKSLTGMDIATGIAENPRPWKTVPKESRPLRLVKKVEANMPCFPARIQGFLRGLKPGGPVPRFARAREAGRRHEPDHRAIGQQELPGRVEGQLIPPAREAEDVTSGRHDVDDEVVEQPAADRRPFAGVFPQPEPHEQFAENLGLLPEVHDVDDDVHILRMPRTASAGRGYQQLGDGTAEKHEPVPQRSDPFHYPHQHRDVVGDTLSH